MYINDFAVGQTVVAQFSTYNKNGASATYTGGTVLVYKNVSTTQRTSLNGVTVATDFDGLTGVHTISIDLSDNTDPGFYAAGNDYFVVLSGATLDSETVSFVICSFSIQNRQGVAVDTWLNTTRTITGGTVDTNNDKTGYSISGTITTLDGLENATQSSIDNIQTDVTGVKAKTDLLSFTGTDVNAEVSSNSLTNIKTKILEIFNDARGQLTTAPSISSYTLLEAIQFVYHRLRNKQNFNGGTGVGVLFEADGSTTLSTHTDTDDGTTYVKGAYS